MSASNLERVASLRSRLRPSVPRPAGLCVSRFMRSPGGAWSCCPPTSQTPPRERCSAAAPPVQHHPRKSGGARRSLEGLSRGCAGHMAAEPPRAKAVQRGVTHRPPAKLGQGTFPSGGGFEGGAPRAGRSRRPTRAAACGGPEG
eukprot:1175708-Prorocentrum_minimum.AAC.2